MYSPFSVSRAAAGVLLENFIRSASERPFQVNSENLVVQRESERRDGPKLLGRTDWGGNLWGQPSVPAVQLMGGAVRALSSRRWQCPQPFVRGKVVQSVRRVADCVAIDATQVYKIGVQMTAPHVGTD